MNDRILFIHSYNNVERDLYEFLKWHGYIVIGSISNTNILFNCAYTYMRQVKIIYFIKSYQSVIVETFKL